MNTRRHLAYAALLAICSQPAWADTSATADGLSLEQIMQAPDWIGNPPVNAYWSLDGSTIWFERQHDGEAFTDQFALDVKSSAIREMTPAAMARMNGARGQYSQDGKRRVYLKDGDIYLAELASGNVRQLTRTSASEAAPYFMADDRRVAWRSGFSYFIYDPANGLIEQAADVLAEDDPAQDKPGFDYLEAHQMRLFSTLRESERKERADEAHSRAQAAGNPDRMDPAIYLGSDVVLRDVSFSPSGRYLLVTTTPAKFDEGPQGTMPNYVTRSGYVEVRDVRTLVGENAPAPQTLHLVDLATGKATRLGLDRLPGIKDDPFKSLRKEALEYHVKHGAPRDDVEKALKALDVRNVTFEGIEWTRDGSRVAVQAHSIDNKDRWIASVNLKDGTLESEHRLHDDAWINWYFNEFGWLPDNRTLWYLSEESGYAHIYVKAADRRAKAITSGKWVVSSPQVSRDGSWFYFIGSRNHPGETQVYRVPSKGGDIQQLTDIGVEPADRQSGGDFLDPFMLSPDETQILFKHDGPARPPELYVQAIGASDARQLTHTVSDKFLSYDWIEPELVEVPSSHMDRPILARVYMPENYEPSKKYPAVMFVHGAGYLHNVHKGWSVYFREFMFNNLLARHGYVVIDMDYRGSAGYGRDWRTAIYRNMGHPELEDLVDGVHWLVGNRNVDADRVGIYGGSYGGFMTLMAMFRAPDTFAAGGALRSVTDWAHYNHEYTSNILNTPLVDPLAYERSSPIEFAEQYKNKPLIMFHGMQDDNVFYKDDVRLAQRLIELHKENWWTAMYPLDPHGFIHADSWLDEYRRIFGLFEENLK